TTMWLPFTRRRLLVASASPPAGRATSRRKLSAHGPVALTSARADTLRSLPSRERRLAAQPPALRWALTHSQPVHTVAPRERASSALSRTSRASSTEASE